ncbi:leucine-rich repeat domain-containing protein [Leucobacter insecticola]|uniref:Leucine-rich repeat domain-containing protein n=1 Tax=Leucobacter insecticola TaxID=2714934 RepID=A0A6G8FH18_9MICO|nr:leucine-rich repeat domain-containing protein [Leucobacter insecticola]QIM15647.1 leucine-rich repeat domain-containing protein [Leucobacter insecticola]
MFQKFFVGKVAVLGLAFAVLPFGVASAEAVESRAASFTLGSEQLCPGATAPGVSHGASGQLVVDLTAVAGGLTDSVVVASDAARSCVNDLTSVSFTNPGPVRSLEIGAEAFSRNVAGELNNQITGVSFPEGLETLNIGSYAFLQSDSGMNHLESVVFPNSLTTLKVGDWAFSQENLNGANSLTELTFPQTDMLKLELGTASFRQRATNGSNTLERVNFPGTVASLRINDSAFQQSVEAGAGDARLAEVILPTGSESLEIGYYSFAQFAPEGATALSRVSFPSGLKQLKLWNSAFYLVSSASTRLESIEFPDGLDSLSIGYGALAQSSRDGEASLKSIDFPDRVSSLEIAGSAFSQKSGNGSTALTSVEFPLGIHNLTIGNYAFQQNARNGSTSLASVVFPEGLKQLEVNYGGFYQEATFGDNALRELEFPAGLESLHVHTSGFQQSSIAGSNSLAAVSFPEGLKNATFDSNAFYQAVTLGENPMKTVSFPGGMDTLSFDRYAFFQSPTSLEVVEFRSTETPVAAISVPDEYPFVPAAATWLWYGEDGADTATDWSMPGEEHELVGYRKLALTGLEGGTLSDVQPGSAFNAQAESFAYPSTENTFAAPRVLAEIPELPYEHWAVDLPAAERDGFTFEGWCPVAPEGGECSEELIPASADRTSRAAAFELLSPTTTLHAVWLAAEQPDPKPGTQGPGGSTDGGNAGAPGGQAQDGLSTTGGPTLFLTLGLATLAIAAGAGAMLRRRKRSPQGA